MTLTEQTPEQNVHKIEWYNSNTSPEDTEMGKSSSRIKSLI